MQLSPRYDTAPIIQLDGPADAVRTPLARQRRRLATLLDGLDDAAWGAPTRCDEWRVRDVVSHLADADGFWALSLQQGAAGTPTRMLDGFDPKATPAALVAAAGDASRAEVTERFHAASDGLVAAFDALDEAGWAALVEAPPGYVSASAMAHHALWDGWVHERDILLPLGETPVEEDDEVLAGLRYAAALGPAFALAADPGRRGALAIDASDPADAFVVEVDGVARVCSGPAPAGVPVLAGPAVTLVEALSIRVPFPTRIDGDDAWLVAGVADVFETTAG